MEHEKFGSFIRASDKALATVRGYSVYELHCNGHVSFPVIDENDDIRFTAQAFLSLDAALEAIVEAVCLNLVTHLGQSN